MQNCVSDVKKWTIHNRLQLNEDKTEAQLFDPTKSSDLPNVLRIGQSDIPFCYSACNLVVMFDSGLTMKQQYTRPHTLRSEESDLFVSFLLPRPQKFLSHLLSYPIKSTVIPCWQVFFKNS